MRSCDEKTKVTPPELARLWGISPAKILAWIRSGELRAVNLASTKSGRPRYAIDVADIQSFEFGRAVVPSGDAGSGRRVRRRTPPSKDYFRN